MTVDLDFFGPDAKLHHVGIAVRSIKEAVSGLEMSQNATSIHWSREEVDSRLQGIMSSIHQACETYGKDGDFINYVKGANIAGFIKVADAMLDQGVV